MADTIKDERNSISDVMVLVTASRLIHREDTDFITAIDVSDYIQEEFGYRIPLKRCEDALYFLQMAMILENIVSENGYKLYSLIGTQSRKQGEKQFTTGTEIGKTLPIYSQGLGIVHD